MSQSTDTRVQAHGRAGAETLIARVTGWERDLVLSVAAQLVQKLPGLVAAIVLARYFDKDLIGQFFFCGVVGAIAATASHLGTDRELRRSSAQRPGEALAMLGQALPLRVVATVALWLGINAVVALVQPDLLLICALTTLYMLVGDLFFSFSAIFVGFRWTGLRLAVGAIGPLLIALSSLAVMWGWSLPAVLVLYVAANTVMVAVAIRMTQARLGTPRLQWTFAAVQPMLFAALPFFFTEIVLLLQSRIDMLMLFSLSTPTSVAEYGTSYRLLEVTRTLIRPLMMVFVPIAAAMAVTQNRPELARLTRRLLTAVSLAGVLLAAICIPLAAPIVTTVWGEDYRSSADVFAILALSTVPLFIGLACLNLAGALHREKDCLGILIVTALANAAMNAVVIPAYGAPGAAWTTFATECLAATALLVLILRSIRSGEMTGARDG